MSKGELEKLKHENRCLRIEKKILLERQEVTQAKLDRLYQLVFSPPQLTKEEQEFLREVDETVDKYGHIKFTKEQKELMDKINEKSSPKSTAFSDRPCKGL